MCPLVVDGEGVWPQVRGGGARLLGEALGPLGVSGGDPSHNLHRDCTIEAGVERFIDPCGLARHDLAVQAVPPLEYGAEGRVGQCGLHGR
jgi:hypothetical protein